jgi:hypothetical protein
MVENQLYGSAHPAMTDHTEPGRFLVMRAVMQSAVHAPKRRPNSGGESHHRRSLVIDRQTTSFRHSRPSQLCGALLPHIGSAPRLFLSFLLFAWVSVFCL